MPIDIGGYSFDGPHTGTASVQNTSGVYAILDRTQNGWDVIDIGESATLASRIDTHDRRNCWQRTSRGKLYVAVLYTPRQQAAGRRQVEAQLRQRYSPPCGTI